MAIRDFFKKTSENEGEQRKSLRDPQQILAWLETMNRLGTVLDLSFSDSDLTPVPAKVGKVAEAAGICSFQCKWKPTKEPAPGQRLRITFPLDKQRFFADLVYQGRGNYLEYRCQLPTAISHAERRDAVRVTMHAHDKFSLIALQGLFAGLGLSGTLVDLSMGGCSFLINRAIQIKNERRLPINEEMLAQGTTFDLVRLPNLPQLPLVECGGTVRSVRTTDRGVIVGLRFEGLGAFEGGILGKFLSERVPGFVAGFPHKHRLRDLIDGDPPEAAEAPEAPPVQVEDSEDPNSDPELQEALSDQDRLNKLRKRGKRILLILADELDRIRLMAILHQDGYRGLFEARSLVQALEHHRRVPLDLVMVDQQVGHMNALKIVTVLRTQGLSGTVPVVVLQRDYDFPLLQAVEAGNLSMLAERPLDFEADLKPAMEKMLGLQEPSKPGHPEA